MSKKTGSWAERRKATDAAARRAYKAIAALGGPYAFGTEETVQAFLRVQGALCQMIGAYEMTKDDDERSE
jgi:hypothetical protein